MSVIGRRFHTLEQIYDAIPDAHCQGLCATSCGPIGASREELRRARRAGFDLTVAAHRLFALTDVDVPIPTCVALDGERCAIYALRPAICRLWGVTAAMPCDHGCQPDRILSDEEGAWLLNEASRLGGPITYTQLTGR